MRVVLPAFLACLLLQSCGSSGDTVPVPGPDAKAELVAVFPDSAGTVDTLLPLDAAQAQDEGPDLVDTPVDAPQGPTADAALADTALEVGAAEVAADADACAPACANKVCGPDGCGGICGFCKSGFICEPDGSACVKYCVPDCEAKGKVCGADGCGGSCGTCKQGFHCGEDFLCHEDACIGSCAGKACGDDGCGKICGLCAVGDYCDAAAKCVPSPCKGIDPKFGTACDGNVLLVCKGEPGPGQTVTYTDCTAVLPAGSKICKFDVLTQKYACLDKPPCAPDCTGKECGDNGCGGLCGSCPAQWACLGNTCVPAEGGDCAGVVTPKGKCYDGGKTLLFCGPADKVLKLDCASAGLSCAWDATVGKFTCQ